jgi:hypothetical protein
VIKFVIVILIPYVSNKEDKNMADNKEKDVKRPLDMEELTMEQEDMVNGGKGSDFPPIFNVSNTTNINMSYYNMSNMK